MDKINKFPNPQLNESKKISQATEREEGIKKFLFIDDNENILESLKRFFGDINNAALFFERCTNKKEAISKILKILPDVIFLDNNLQGDGIADDGIEIIDELKERGINAKIYSITSSQNPSVLEKYEKRNVEVVSKNKIIDIASKIKENL